jgi:uncharacterized protein YjbJ (UPF0337 family)
MEPPGSQKEAMMSDHTQERAEGMFDNVKGQGKEAWGRFTGDEKKEMEGQAEQVKGQAKEDIAEAKKPIEDALKKDFDR